MTMEELFDVSIDLAMNSNASKLCTKHAGYLTYNIKNQNKSSCLFLLNSLLFTTTNDF